jgi:hypothetical protein
MTHIKELTDAYIGSLSTEQEAKGYRGHILEATHDGKEINIGYSIKAELPDQIHVGLYVNKVAVLDGVGSIELSLQDKLWKDCAPESEPSGLILNFLSFLLSHAISGTTPKLPITEIDLLQYLQLTSEDISSITENKLAFKMPDTGPVIKKPMGLQ